MFDADGIQYQRPSCKRDTFARGRPMDSYPRRSHPGYFPMSPRQGIRTKTLEATANSARGTASTQSSSQNRRPDDGSDYRTRDPGRGLLLGNAATGAAPARRRLNAGRVLGRRRQERHVQQPRHARGSDRDHVRPESRRASATCWSSSSRSTTRRRPTGRETTAAQATGRRSSTRARNNAASPKTPSPTSRPQGCGRARS